MTPENTPPDEYQSIAEYYDHVTPYAERADVDFFVGEALKSGGPVLEVGCGTGRILIPTAREGVQIHGLDLSPHMLEILRERLRQEPPDVQARVTLSQGDMRSFDLGGTFQLVTFPFRPFQHLTTVEDQMTCLERVRAHLEPGGRLILDLFNPKLESLLGETGVEMKEGVDFSMPDGRQVSRSVRFVHRDLFNQVSQVELIYYVTHPDGRVERLVHDIHMRYLYRFEAEHLLERCGFSVESLYGDYDRSPYGSKYPGELIFIARRR
jgi:SAM-dependent methyltransferase